MSQKHDDPRGTFYITCPSCAWPVHNFCMFLLTDQRESKRLWSRNRTAGLKVRRQMMMLRLPPPAPVLDHSPKRAMVRLNSFLCGRNDLAAICIFSGLSLIEGGHPSYAFKPFVSFRD